MIDWQNILQIIIDTGLKLLQALILLIVGWLVIKHFTKWITTLKGFKKLDISAQSFLRSLLSIGLKVILIISIIGVLGVPLTSILTVLASAGLAIGLSLQGALSNFAGGFMILIFKPFKAGDYIDNGANAGFVESINVFYTKLLTIDNKLITIPNKSMIDTAITNYSAQDKRRVDLKIRASHKDDIEKVKQVLFDIAYNHPLTLKEPLPFVRLYAHLQDSMEYILRVWTLRDDYWPVYFDLMEQIKKEFDKAGITIPYQQISVHIKDKN
ncbi:MAG TPA: mechanosensitive ion channel [Clostridiales bacterium]|jgi:small conductance mechanosensitive channel|nr:mechanosensitive ion channel [Clostridiales bacterium]